jgi:hypothetical protein
MCVNRWETRRLFRVVPKTSESGLCKTAFSSYTRHWNVLALF